MQSTAPVILPERLAGFRWTIKTRPVHKQASRGRNTKIAPEQRPREAAEDQPADPGIEKI